MESKIPHPVHASQGDARLRLLRALLRRRTLQELVISHPKFALALHAARARIMLQLIRSMTSPLVLVETSITRDAPAVPHQRRGAAQTAQGWDAAVKAACQTPKPHSGAVQDAMLHQLGVLELLVQHSALLLRLTARMAAAAAAAAAAAHQAGPKQDSHSSQCAETVCLADDAASHCCSSKRTRPGADDGFDVASQPALKRACHASVPQPVQPLRRATSLSAAGTAVQGVAGKERPSFGNSDDSTGSSGAFQGSGADLSHTEMSESEPSSDYDADLEDDASSSCS